MSQTKKHLIQKTVMRVLGDYGFDPDSAKGIADRITSEIYSLVPARIVSTGKIKAPPASPEILRFQFITGYYPPAAAREEIEQLMLGKTDAELAEAYRAWCFKGYNKNSATWLKWVRGNNISDKPLVVK